MTFLVFLGSIRDSSPPRPARLGVRVAQAILDAAKERYPAQAFELIDVIDYPFEPVFKPQFAYPVNQAPADLDQLAKRIRAADGYLMISPEYNHSMSPALAHLLNHFGSSLFAYKPSAIVTYSAGQWGGVRAAVGMRSFLSELGCLPVSAMIHLPRAQQVLAADGALNEGEDPAAWSDYFGRSVDQLLWWAQAAAQQRQSVDPHQRIQDFKRNPSQRDAP